MNLPIVVAAFICPAVNVPTEVWQVAPDAHGKTGVPATTQGKDRAVLLIPGLKIHPFRPGLATRPGMHRFQEPTSELVRTLARDFDVFAFGYAQTMPVDVVAQAPGLRDAVVNLRKAGYKEVVLIGHSAGGVIARLFTEMNPDAGMTKLITVASPHLGSELADIIRAGYPKVQAPFVQSLATEARGAELCSKAHEKIEMACVVCKLRRLEWDGLVKIGSAWPEECQKCGIPAVLLPVSHWEAMHGEANAKVIAELAREKLTRWSAEEVEKAKKVLFRDPPEKRRPVLFRQR